MADLRRILNRSWVRLMVSPALILVAAVAVVVLLVMLLKSEPVTVRKQVTIPRVRTAAVKRHQGGLTIEANGLVVPYREIELAAEVAGRIVERAEISRQGNFVKAGTLLVKIDPQDYELEEERWEKELQQATVSMDELAQEIAGTESLIELAQRELALRAREMQRQRSLAGVVTSTDMERAEANELAAQTALLTLRNLAGLLKISEGRLEGARDLTESKLKRARLDLKRTEIVAPVDGVIVAEMIEEDAYVQKGTLLLTLEDTSKVEVKCKLEMEQLYWLWDRRSPSAERVIPGDANSGDANSGDANSGVARQGDAGRAYEIPETSVKVVYRLSGRKDLEYVWDGYLARFDGIGLDARTRTVPCCVVVDEPQKRVDEPAVARSGPPALVRGMYVTIQIQLDPKTPLLRVPEEAVQPGNGEDNAVWRVRDGKLSIESVRFVMLVDRSEQDDSPTRDALIYVESPEQLSVQDRVVISPMAAVRSGMEVEIAGDEKKE